MLLSAGLLMTLVAVGQNSTIGVDVPLVTVDVMVSDAAGRPVVNLSRDDFEILEDGKPQDIRVFSPVDSPYSIQLLIDRSAGANDYLPLFESALARFFAGLKPQDRVSIGAFDERSKNPELLLDWSEARNASPRNIDLNPVIRGIPFVNVTVAGGVDSLTRIDHPQADLLAIL